MLRIRQTLILLLVTLMVQAQTGLDAKLGIDPKVKIGKLSNGLTYYLRKNVEPKNRAELRLVVNAGSILESDQQLGLAHFVEHMAFNGTKNFKKQELVDFLEKSGVNFGADLNAYTSFDETVYELQVPTDSIQVFKKAMQILEDWAHQVSFEPVEIDKERGVIVEEWRLGRGADARLRDKFFPVILKGSQYAKRLPIGTKESIEKSPYSELTKFYKDWYRPDLQAVIVVGDIDIAETEKMIKDHFGKIPAAKTPKPRTKFGVPAFPETRASILTDAEQPYNVVQVYYLRPEIPASKTEKEYRASMVRNLFNQMISSRLEEIAQKPEAPFLFGSSSYGSFIGDKDAFSLIAVAKTAKDIEASIATLLTENERVKQYGFAQTELDRAVKSTLSRIENMYNERDKTKSVELLQEYVRNYLKQESIPGIEKEFEMHQKYLPTIQLAEVNALIKDWITTENRSVVITAPEKEKADLMTADQVTALLNKPIGKLDAYVDKVTKGALLPVEPTAGKVVSEKKYPSIETTEWTLSNGAKVILKPTQFKNDDIQFSAISWGGSSLYDDKDYVNAANASVIASIGGIGDFDIQALQKELAGKNCFVSTSVANYMQGLNGNSTTKDLETAFQWLHGYFVAPRKDANMFEVIKQQMKVQLANKDKDPASVFADSVNYIMGNYHPRRKPFSMETMQQLELDRAFEIYKERFSNAGQFTFTFVGNFDLENIKPLVEKYIASLPSTNQKEQWKDVGIRYPKGVVSKVIRKGKEPKASVRLAFTGEVSEISDLDEVQVGQLTKALAIKLREVLREDAGGVYGVGVGGGFNREPVNSYGITIQFGCAPENVDKLIALVMEEIKNTKNNGVPAVNIEKVVAEQTRSLENDIKENNFWRFRLEQNFFRGTDPTQILQAADKIKLITVDKTKELANKLFNENNMVKLILLPEE
ncbi:MAG: insulinase family protein [Sediminibacterium sp. Gen4]|jgi:zinc protease|uniref:M16 family metallopeptidase n=1 Tax=unclassified Sediminibacterium TaxID=2635961 RepID=UPI0015BF93F5|nr:MULTISPECIES: M16 family metallopeptidase [unclassified Sediminibacterium]MBW0162894.1 insulinase family protein [Sediminibacterium sp.]NWK67363.1 insulinase family protein [Sediminibacterium sp. Gen4]